MWVWIYRLGRRVDRGTYFRRRIFLGGVLVRFLIFFVRFPGSSRNGSGLCLNLWIQNKFVYLRQSVQSTAFCRIELPKSFLCHPAFYVLWCLGDTVVVVLRNSCDSWLALPRVFFLILSSNCFQLWFIAECCHFEGKLVKWCLKLNWISIFVSKLGKQNWICGQN